MPLPGSLAVIRITGTFLKANGDPEAGTVTVYSDEILQSPSDNTIVSPLNFTGTLNSDGQIVGEDGNLGVLVPATNDPQWTPLNFVYTVKETLSTGTRSYKIPVPYDTIGAALDLADAAPVINAPDPVTYVLVSQGNTAGGYAKLDGTGKIDPAVLPAGIGGGFKGTWSGVTAYSVGDVVVRSGATYGSIQSGTNKDPLTQPTYWQVMPVFGDLEAKVWNGTSYVTSDGLGAYVGPSFPTGALDGSIWFKLVLGSTERAAPYSVGFLGDPTSLTVLNPGDPFTGTIFNGHADWVGNALLVNSDVGGIIENYRVNGALFFTGGVNHHVRNCVVVPPNGQIYGLGCNNLGGTLIVEDTTINAQGTDLSGALEAGQRAEFRRCDVSGAENGIVLQLIPAADFAGGTIVDQCWIHDITFDQFPADHCDSIQVSQDGTNPTWLTIQNCYIEGGLGPSGQAISASITMGEGSGSTAGFLTPKVHNNAILKGGFHYRQEYRTQNAVVTDNNFGSVDGPSGEFGFAVVSVAGSAPTWTNNRDGNGQAGTGSIVPNPNP